MQPLSILQGWIDENTHTGKEQQRKLDLKLGDERHPVAGKSNISHKINLQYLKGKESKGISWSATAVKTSKK